MSYIGNTATQQAYTAAVDYFNGNASTTAFTLSRPVASVMQMIVVIENVPQNPSSAYTVSGNTITFTSAPPSGTNNIWVEYTSPITQVIQPGQGTVGTAQLVGGTVVTTADATINGLTVGKGGGSGSSNTVVGNGALAASSADQYISAFGYLALAANTTGAYNTGIGAYALKSMTTGTDSTALGVQALDNNTTGSFNTGLGRFALHSNTTASNNTAVGYQAGYTQAGNANGNTLLGYQAGYTGNSFIDINSYNTYVGYQAAYSATTGIKNTFIGAGAGTSVTTGYNNTILGRYSGNQGGLDIRTASNYCVISDGDGNVRLAFSSDGGARFACNNFNTGASSSSAGFVIETNGSPTAYSPFINHSQTGTGLTTYYAFINGNGVVGTIKCTGSSTQFNTSSDARLKENVVDAPSAIDSINQIGIKSFDWKADGLHQDYGVIAQELQQIAPEAISEGQTEDEMWGVDYSKLVPRMIKAIQELKAEVDALKAGK